MRRVVMPAAMAVGMFTSAPARAASLSGPITGWASGVPTYISMYEYVPSKLAAKPPILVVSHYCSGTASGVFQEAQGGGLVSAADQYGFLMVFPQTSNNCWDVGTTKSLTHDGGGDTQAIVEMVQYEIAKRGADANRVYAAGTSSGAMMTEALLAVYPDVFKAGAEFSGVPAGCWSVNDPNGQWSTPCATGQVMNTPQQWGDMVRAMYPAYSGYRPRIQLWHGTADMTINYNNQLEAIKEWTNVLGLTSNPSSTPITLNSHQWTRQSWQDACGFTVLEAWAEQSGPHGTDANLNATYVIPFLGLDKTGPDPQVASCGDAGSSDAGSSAGDGGIALDGASGNSSSSGSVGSTDGGSGTTSGGTGSSGSTVAGGSSGGGSGSSGTAMGSSGSSEGADSGAGEAAAPASGGCACRVSQDGAQPGSGALATACLLGAVLYGRRRREVATRRAMR
jgi:poly(hydroxyalkanoate) depolymerase family esterase